MNNKKSTKRTLLSSVLSLVLCMAMLIGTTFAWFTDSVTSAGNTIQSGTLKVDLVDGQDNSLAGKIIKFVDKDDNDLWEPGCTYETEPVYVVNKGNLALKYQIVINGIDGNAKLLEAIDWTVTVDGVPTDLSTFADNLIPGQTEKSGAIVLSGHMKEEAGNEYQGLTAEGISIAVYATQFTSESDSFDNTYDEQAEYAAQTMLKNVAAVAAGESATVKLESDGYVVLNNASPIGAKVAGDVTLDLNGKTLFVKAEDGNAQISLFNILRNGKLTVTGNGTIEMLAGANPLVTAIFNNTAGTLVIENGTYKMDHPSTSSVALIPTIVDNNGNAAAVTTIINGGNFYHTRCMFRNFPSNNGITQLTINGGTFNGKADDWATIWNQKASDSTREGQSLITINGGTFNYVEINNGFDTGVTIADGVVIPENITAAKLATKLTPVDGVITIDKDYIVTGEWTSLYIPTGSAYAPINDEIVVEGNGHTISGLTTSLLRGNIAGKVTINDLTIKDSVIESTYSNGLGNGAFIAYRDNFGGGSLTMKNCHAVNVTVNSTDDDVSSGALVGHCSGNDAVVFTNCTVTNCTINGKNSVGGIVGHIQSEGTFTNCKVTNTKLASTKDGDWRVGAIIGTGNASAKTFTACTESGNTLSQTGKTAPGHNLYGRIVSPGTLTIDGVEVQ